MDKKILVVDDDPELLKLVALRLKVNGYKLITAGNGCDGLKKAELETPDLIILDIKMAQMDGYTMLRKLKSEPSTSNIPIVVLTSYDQMKDLFEMEGISDYILKPFDEQDFLLRISRAMQNKNTEDTNSAS
ncbi:MAG: PleD family two-component system response regulator [Candidatus Omnitrophota bacterium]